MTVVRLFRFPLCATMILTMTACGERSNPSNQASVATIDRGRYLVNTVAACQFCHTPLNPDGTRDATRSLAGVDCFLHMADPADPNPGDPTLPELCMLSSANLTNDATGLKNKTDAQIKNALLNGIASDGSALNPSMPFWQFHAMSDEDANAIVAYLRTVPAVEHTPQPADERAAKVSDFARGIPFKRYTGEDIPNPSPGYVDPEAAARGKYLATQVGLCSVCHTPFAPVINSEQQVKDKTRWMAGGLDFTSNDLGLIFLPPGTVIYSKNLTPDPSGIGNWSIDDIVRVIREGIDKDGDGVCAATHGAINSFYAGMPEQDARDIAHYLKSLPPVFAPLPGPDCKAPVAR